MRSGTRVGASALVGLVLVTWVASAVAAHADLLDANPPPFTRVDTAPSELVLHFSEQLEDRYTRVEVINGNGTHFEGGTSVDADRRTRVTVPLEPLPDGVYTVRWRALSVDTHTTTGTYLLAVNASFTGMSTADDPVDHSEHIRGTSSARGWGEALVRASAFAGASLAVGVPVFLLTVHRGVPAWRATRLVERTGATGAAVGAVATAVHVWLIGERIELGLVGTLSTSTGSVLAARAGLLAVTSVALWMASRRTGRPRHVALWTGTTVGAASLVATSLASHAAALTDLRTLAIFMDSLHLVAAATWIGGVVALIVIAGPDADDRPVDQFILRFSPVASVAVSLVIVTGVFASWLHLREMSGLVRSPYGWALVTKMVLVLPLLALGWLNSRVLAHRLSWRNVRRQAQRTLRRSVAAEAAIFAAVLVAAGFLANTAPPSAITVQGDGSEAPAGTTGIVHVFEDDGFNITVAIEPQPVTVGFQRITVAVAPIDGAMPENAAVGLSFHPPSDPYGEGDTVQLERRDNTTWAIEAPTFTEAGDWTVDVFLQGRGTFVIDEFTVRVDG